MLNKRALFDLGLAHITAWCAINEVEAPDVEETDSPERYGTCAYYREGIIHISVKACASVGLSGRSWSYPGYSVDRTPYGVLAHELGHHVDRAHGPNGGVLSHLWRPLDAKPLTGYCPNDNEWFAELFRLFVTNPDLFAAERPKIADLFFKEWPRSVEQRPWQGVLSDSPRHIKAASNRIARAGS